MDKVATKEELNKNDQDKVNVIDFKMVTFTLAGRDYALDIMKVKEISKANKFTYVPNAAPFVRGVYNLRGDIISVIDLRVFFNQFFEKDEDQGKNNLDNMIILRLEDHVIAVIVDTIEKVVGVSSEEIQPPHPLFGDINIKYISGVVEKNDSLYVILDVERIFNSQENSESLSTSTSPLPVADKNISPAASIETTKAVEKVEVPIQEKVKDNSDDINLKFIKESLETFKLFYPSALNRDWIKKRFKQWSENRKSEGKEVQFAGEGDALSFLRGFNSPYTEALWDPAYMKVITSFIEKNKSGNYTIWNPGCAKGMETYSIAVMMKEFNPGLNLKILANDKDLINISTAPGLTVRKEDVSDIYGKYIVESNSGFQFSKEIKNSIIFEYHDISHDNNLPPLDMVVIRDVLSHMPTEIQTAIMLGIEENVKPGGLIIVGANENLKDESSWEILEQDGIRVYRKK